VIFQDIGKSIGTHLAHDSSYLTLGEMVTTRIFINVDLRKGILEDMDLSGEEGFIQDLDLDYEGSHLDVVSVINMII